jgi:hypothetical protein
MSEAGEVPDSLLKPVVVVGTNDLHLRGGWQGTADDRER